jgi:hypothetical protein
VILEIVASCLRSLWDMLQSYFPVYQLALDLQRIRTAPELLGSFSRTSKLPESVQNEVRALLENIERVCAEMGFGRTARLSKRTLDRPLPENYGDALPILTLLNGSAGIYNKRVYFASQRSGRITLSAKTFLGRR